MKCMLVFTAFLLLCCGCSSRPAEEESVVSVYTTPQSAGGGQGAPLDVYRQIADNIAERITQPIYRFFGFNSTHSTTTTTTTKRPFEHIELGTSDTNKTNPDRDVEEISLESAHKSDKKPEKFTLFSSYLPVKENFEFNVTNDNSSTNDINLDTNDINLDKDDNSLELDDVDNDFDDTDKGRGGPFVYILELMGSVIQLLWGGFLALFKPSTEDEKQTLS